MKYEILFRGKRVDNGEWVKGNLFVPDEGHDAPTQICMGTNIVRITYDVDPDTVSEFTGLRDKNGERIFDGDIVMVTTPEGCACMVEVHIGEYSDDEMVFVGVYGEICGKKAAMIAGKEKYYEIVGNVWDDHDLLEA